MRGMPPPLPQYQQQAQIDVTQAPDVESGGAALIEGLRHAGDAGIRATDYELNNVEQAKQDQLKMEISQATSAFKQTALTNPSAQAGLNGFDDQAKQYAASILQNTNSFNRTQTGNLLNYYSNTNRTDVVDAVNKQAKLSTFANFVGQNAQGADDISKAINSSDPNDPNRFDQALTLHGQQQQALKNALVQGVIQPGEYQTAFDQNRKNFQQQVVLKQYEDAVNGGTVPQFMQNFQNADLPGLNEQDKLGMMHDFSAITNQRLADLGTTRAQLDQSQKDNITGILAGGQPNATVMQNTKMVDPDKYDGYAQQVTDATRQYSILQHAATLPPSDQQTLLSALKPTDPTSSTYGHDTQFYNTISKLVDNDNKKFTSDPMTYIGNHPAIQQAAQARNLADNVGATAPYNPSSNINDPVVKPWQQAVDLQVARGMSLYGGKNSVKLMTNSDSQSNVAQISAASPATQVQYFNSLRNTYKGFYPIVIRQLAKDGLPSNMQLLAAYNPSDPNIQTYATALSTPVKELKQNLDPKDATEINKAMYDGAQSPSSGFNNYISSLSGYSGSNNPVYVNQLKESLKSIAYQNMASGKYASAGDATKAALDSIGNEYNYTSINGQNIRVPTNYNQDTIKNYALENQNQLVNSFPFATNKVTPPEPGGTADPTQSSQFDLKQNIQRGHWVTAPSDDSLVWVDSQGMLRTDKNSQPLSIKFKDAQNNFQPSDGIHQILDKLKPMVPGISPFHYEELNPQ